MNINEHFKAYRKYRRENLSEIFFPNGFFCFLNLVEFFFSQCYVLKEILQLKEIRLLKEILVQRKNFNTFACDFQLPHDSPIH